MPTARPSISASAGVIVLRSVNTVKATAPARPDADTEQRDEQRQAGGDQAAERDDEHEEGDGQAEHLTGPDQRGVLGDLDAVGGGEAGVGQGGVGARRDERAVVDRHRLGVVVELHLDDGVPAVLADQARGGGGVGDGLAVLVLRAARGEVGLALSARSALAVSSCGRPAAIWARSPGREGSVGLAASSWSSSGLAAGELALALLQLGAAGIELLPAVLELGGGGGEVGGGLVEAAPAPRTGR